MFISSNRSRGLDIALPDSRLNDPGPVISLIETQLLLPVSGIILGPQFPAPTVFW